MSSEAHRRARKKYKEKASIKNWQVDLKEKDFEEVERERKKQGLSRSELLRKIIKEN